MIGFPHPSLEKYASLKVFLYVSFWGECFKKIIILTDNNLRLHPYRPMGRGEVERLFQFVDSSFRPEVQALVDRGELTTLEELNHALRSWLDGYCHQRVHGSTRQTPRERFGASSKPRKRKSLLELNELFLWEEKRTADKTGCIQLAGNTYEVDAELSRKRITLRYDPYNLTSGIQVWLQDKRYADATPVELRRRRKRALEEQVQTADPQPEQLSFLDLAEKKRQAAWAEDEIRYALNKGGDRACRAVFLFQNLSNVQ